MSRPLVTAAEVEAAAPQGHLRVPGGAIITPLAREQAASLGVELLEPGDDSAPTVATQPDDLARHIRGIVEAMLSSEAPTQRPAARPVKLCRGAEAVTEPFPYPGPPPGQQVRTGDVVTSADGSPMAAGYMTLTEGTFDWTLNYDEIQIVLEGELHIGTPQGTKVGKPGDVLYVPKGSGITFGTPSWARFVYVTFPADWESQ